MKPQRLERHTVVESATIELRRRILSGAFGEGEALRQDALAEEFGISRIPIREAFRQLAAEGLITIHPHRGAVVSSFSPGEISELFDLRLVLEPDLIRRAVPLQTPGDLAESARILSAYEKAIGRGDVNAWGELNTEYHLSLYRPAARPQTLQIVQLLLVHTDRFTRLQLAVGGGTLRAMEEHAALLTLCRRGLADAAADLVLSHVTDVRRDLLLLAMEKSPG